jgi:hypothetical protein
MRTSRLGADTDTMRAAQRSLHGAARRLDELMAQGHVAVGGLGWRGTDADEVRTAWRAVAAAFEEARRRIDATAEALAAQATEQDQASAGGSR